MANFILSNTQQTAENQKRLDQANQAIELLNQLSQYVGGYSEPVIDELSSLISDWELDKSTLSSVYFLSIQNGKLHFPNLKLFGIDESIDTSTFEFKFKWTKAIEKYLNLNPFCAIYRGSIEDQDILTFEELLQLI
ncbi:MAG: hypothetical protein ACRCXZ_09625 [Patescibacteria group bacterium]